MQRRGLEDARAEEADVCSRDDESVVLGSADMGGRCQRGQNRGPGKMHPMPRSGRLEGEDAASLESLIKDIVAGKVKHKSKLSLSATEIADIAAYWGQAGK